MTAVAPASETEAVLGQARTENFPVASLVLPRSVRGHLMALYGYARLVDDTGDEAAGDRMSQLDELEADLERVWDGTPHNPLIAALKPTVDACQLEIEPFRRLIDANRQDQTIKRYQTFEDLLGYCALSANPIGELVLRIFGFGTPDRIALSDKVCSALQLAEHWQDVGEDYARERVYLPVEDLRRFGVAEDDLRAATATAEVKALMEFEVQRARALLREGAPLAQTLPGRCSLAVAAFVGGGRAALKAIERAGYDVLGAPPRAGRLRRALETAATLVRR